MSGVCLVSFFIDLDGFFRALLYASLCSEQISFHSLNGINTRKEWVFLKENIVIQIDRQIQSDYKSEHITGQDIMEVRFASLHLWTSNKDLPAVECLHKEAHHTCYLLLGCLHIFVVSSNFLFSAVC